MIWSSDHGSGVGMHSVYNLIIVRFAYCLGQVFLHDIRFVCYCYMFGMVPLEHTVTRDIRHIRHVPNRTPAARN